MQLGDLVKEITTKLGIKQCIPCQARQQKMNDLHSNLSMKLKSIWDNSSSGSSESP